MFAFPFGHANDYLMKEYLPERAEKHGMVAAFGTSADPCGRRTPRGTLRGRYAATIGKTLGELIALLRS